MGLKSFDFKQVTVIVGGRIISGYADGDDAVVVERDEVAWQKKSGADGEVTRSKTNDRSGRLRIKLMASSESNDILSGFAQTGENAPGSDLIPWMVKDGSGRAIYSAEQAWIEKRPTRSFGQQVGSMEWVLPTDNLFAFDGGN